MILAVHHVALSVADMERSLRFYCDLLGFRELWRREMTPGNEMRDRIFGLKDCAGRITMLQLGDMRLELFEFASPPQDRPGDPRRPVNLRGITHICLDASGIHEEHARLSAAGVSFHCPPQQIDRGKWITYGRDPDGNVIELREVAA